MIINSGFTPRIIIDTGTFDSFTVKARNAVAIPRLNKLFGKNNVITKSNVPKSFTLEHQVYEEWNQLYNIVLMSFPESYAASCYIRC